MLNSVLLKGLRDRRASLAWWAAGLMLFIAAQMAVYPSLRDNPGLQSYADSSVELMTALTGSSDISSPVGYLNSQLYFMMLPLVLSILAISIGSDALAGEEGRGTLDLLLSAPLPRYRVALEKAGTMALATAGEALAAYAAAALAALASGMDVGYLNLAGATLGLFALALLFGTFALLLGAAGCSKGLSVGIAAALGIGTLALNSLALINDTLRPWRRASPFHYYNGNNPLANGVDWWGLVVLAAAAAACLGASLFFFQRRDLTV